MGKKGWLAGLAACLALATLSPLASPAPDGLEKVAGDKGFLGLARGAPLDIAADYLFPGIGNHALATILAGWLGVVIVFALAYGATYVVIRLRKETARP